MKTLKSFPKQLKTFARGLSKHNIRYRIGKQALEVYFYDGTTIPVKIGKAPILKEWYITIAYKELPSNIHLLKSPKVFCIRYGFSWSRRYEKCEHAIQEIIRILKSDRAWQKKGIDTRKA